MQSAKENIDSVFLHIVDYMTSLRSVGGCQNLLIIMNYLMIYAQVDMIWLVNMLSILFCSQEELENRYVWCTTIQFLISNWYFHICD